MKRFAFLLFFFVFSVHLFAQTGYVRAQGKHLVDARGNKIILRGTNLGNWMVPEGYMFLFKDATSPRLINQTLTELVGPEKVKAFWRKYLDVYITAEDIHYLKSIGMNWTPWTFRSFR
jgi:hypothetical protein